MDMKIGKSIRGENGLIMGATGLGFKNAQKAM